MFRKRRAGEPGNSNVNEGTLKKSELVYANYRGKEK